jgi:threonine synthase
LRLLVEHDGWMVAVDEPEIQHGRDQLARLGFSVEATSAIVWNALQQIQGQVPEPVVAVLTGAGWKSP